MAIEEDQVSNLGQSEDDLSEEDAFLRSEVIRLVGEQNVLGAELGRVRSMTEHEYTDQTLEEVRLLEARLVEITRGLEVIHKIRVRLGLAS